MSYPGLTKDSKIYRESAMLNKWKNGLRFVRKAQERCKKYNEK